ncbi:phage portal protein [Williamsia phyllosphaerae]|uniref:Phage portal protein, SPP1 Gp6-like n=1 Tax=Williamsia phyllosphaerae TaxID=885042 RepID=A0ABQ1V4V5_9NOCA|nr:phage portal protein [Williamsia phyllosphaerae]GGF39048.1 hypothetical protein GCM10007298_38430 [Williamsia phyllosphaerae]
MIPRLAIPGLDDADAQTLATLMNQLDAKSIRNVLRTDYYESRYRFRDLMISTPPQLRDKIEAVLDWPAKSVDLLSQRVMIDGFVSSDASPADLGVDELWRSNNLDVRAPQAHDSALIHACAFVCVTLGDVASGEPPVIMSPVSALNGTALWDVRRQRLSAALEIVDRAVDGGQPTVMVMYLPDRVVTLEQQRVGGNWNVTTRPHRLGRVPVEPMPYRPHLDRPFGRSRISRPIMSITDSALRTVVRSEIGAEFFAAPRLAALNMPKDAFEDGGWNALLSRALVVDAPAQDDLDADPNFQPSIQQLQQISMQPHVEQLRMFATLFASAASLPLDAVGIVQDNPSSAEAIEKAEKNLTLEAERTGSMFASAWTRAMQTAYMMANDRPDAPEVASLRAKPRDPRMTSKAAAADTMLKQIAVIPWLAETEVALEQLGYDRPTIDRLLAERRRANGGSVLERLRQQSPVVVSNASNDDGATQPVDQPQR